MKKRRSSRARRQVHHTSAIDECDKYIKDLKEALAHMRDRWKMRLLLKRIYFFMTLFFYWNESKK